MQRSFPAGNGDLPAFLSLTGHLLQKPRGEAMNAENAPLVCRASLTPGEDGVARRRGKSLRVISRRLGQTRSRQAKIGPIRTIRRFFLKSHPASLKDKEKNGPEKTARDRDPQIAGRR
jgi:hypothetical protein